MGHWQSAVSNTKRAWRTEWSHGGVWWMWLTYLALVGVFVGVNWFWQRRSLENGAVPDWWLTQGWTFTLLYCVGSLVMLFAFAIWCGETLRALRGERVSWGRGCRNVWARKVPLMVWFVFAMAVTAGLDFTFRWSPLILVFLSMVWGAATIFTLPALVTMTDGWNPLIYLKRSCAVLWKVWIELLLGYLGAMLPLVIVSAVVMVAAAILYRELHMTGVAIAVGVVGGGVVLVGGIVLIFWLMLYFMSLYLHATEDQSAPEIGNASPK